MKGARTARDRCCEIVTLAVVFVLPISVAQVTWAADVLKEREELGSGPICGTPPQEMQTANRLRDATRFAIDPRASAEHLVELAEVRPEHFLSAALAFSLAGESFQKSDFRMAKTTAPARVDHNEIRALASELADSSREYGALQDLNSMWQRIHEAHPIQEVDVSWACLQSRTIADDNLEVVLGHGSESCGILERTVGWDEAMAVATSQRWTVVSLSRLQDREAVIDGTDLTAPLYAIESVRFGD